MNTCMYIYIYVYAFNTYCCHHTGRGQCCRQLCVDLVVTFEAGEGVVVDVFASVGVVVEVLARGPRRGGC